jgi:putative FmdB family regulatory protein
MPTLPYRCQSCDALFDFFHFRDEAAVCPVCESDKVERFGVALPAVHQWNCSTEGSGAKPKPTEGRR